MPFKDDICQLADLKLQISQKMILLCSTVTFWQCAASNIIFCDICCFRSASWRMLSLKGIVNCSVFTALHGMQTRSSDENTARLSVRLSVTRMNCDKTVEISVQIYIPYER